MLLIATAVYFFIVILSEVIGLVLHKGADGLVMYLILIAVICLPLYFVWFSVALLVLKPLDALAKNRIVASAKSKLDNFPDIKIIGVAGSYGKTTMKEVLKQVLSIKYKVLSTPDSVNTPVGIGRWVLNKVTDEAQILIVEMGEHYTGDIKEICDITKPNFAVVTGINESHLERMGNMDTVISTVFEIVSSSEPGAVIFLNADDKRVVDNYQQFAWPDHKTEKFQISNFKFPKFNVEKLCWEGELDSLGKIEINLLGEYAFGDVDAAVKIGKSMGMSDEELRRGIANIKPVEHRLQTIKSAGDVLVIDDAYNGNPDGVREAINVLSKFSSRRKVFITPGLVEMGKSTAYVHRTIGQELAGVADVVILIKNSVTPFIAEGFKSDDKVVWFDTALKAHAGLKNILKPGDVVLFQNDWGDQYL